MGSSKRAIPEFKWQKAGDDGRRSSVWLKKTLEIDLFPSSDINTEYLKECFKNLGHSKSYDNLIEKTTENPELWES